MPVPRSVCLTSLLLLAACSATREHDVALRSLALARSVGHLDTPMGNAADARQPVAEYYVAVDPDAELLEFLMRRDGDGLREQLARFDPRALEALDDLLARRSQPGPGSAWEGLTVPVVVGPDPPRGDFERALWVRRHRTPGITKLIGPGYSADGELALIAQSMFRAGLWGGGGFWLYRRVDGRWEYQRGFGGWIS